MEIRDGGKGLGLRKPPSAVLWGPVDTRKRAHLVGSDFRVEDHSGGGTTVSVRVPLERDRKRGARL